MKDKHIKAYMKCAQAFAEYAAQVIPTGNTNRGSAEYRKHLIKVLAQRTVLEAGGKA